MGNLFTLFLNPANMVLGGALISAPIIIHLINRMRYKRIQWAAMEFLLKSQKRNRRRLIIEQLVLLLLRILLVLLAGLLLARFLGFSFAGIFQPQNTVHLVILDDRLSMTDHWKTEEGDPKDSFNVSKQLIEKEIAKPAAQARSPQRLVLARLSDLTKPRPDPNSPVAPPLFDQRLTEDSLKDLNNLLPRIEECSFLHLDLDKGVKAAREILDKHGQDEKFLHIVSDFRQRQWGEPGGAELAKTLAAAKQAGIQITLVDAAHPVRTESQKVPLYHDNLAIVDLRPEARVAAEGIPVQFTVAVANFSTSERKNVRVTIKVEGVERPEGSLTIQSIPAGTTSAQTFQVALVKLGYNLITANLENEEVGLQGDNIRYATLEVRRQVPILLIDGDLAGGDKPGGDSRVLRDVFTSNRGYEVMRAGVSELEKPTLEQYPGIYILNVRTISDKGLTNLRNYVGNGGSVAFFLGDRVNDPAFYNTNLYENGKGIFPVPLADRPTQPLTDADKLDRLLDGQAKVFVRNESHPIVAEAFKDKGEKGERNFMLASFKFLIFDRYYPVPRLKWEPEGGRADEVLTLPNRRSIEDYKEEAIKIREGLPIADEKQAKYRPGLENHQRALATVLISGKNLFELGNALEALLQDPGTTDDPKKPSMAEFWKQADPKITELKTRIEKLIEIVRYGDPLLVAGRYKKGRTVAFLSTAGNFQNPGEKKWNDWSGGNPGSASFPPFILDLQKFLTSLESDAILTVGSPLQLQVDATRYEPRLKAFFQGEIREGNPAKEAKEGAEKKDDLVSLGELTGPETAGKLLFQFDNTQKPGIYYFDLTQRGDGTSEPKVERRGFAFNVDAINESDLRRAARSDLDRGGNSGIYLNTPGTPPPWADRKTDLSESAWFYLLFLVILIIEQALAVHLSFHLKGSETPAPAKAVPQAA